MNQEHVDQSTGTLGSGQSRRGVLRTLGVVGASGLLAMVGQAARAADRPHENLQDRSEQRNRKQRNNNKNNNNNRNNQNNNNNNNNNNQTNQLGSTFGLGVSVEIYNQNSATYSVRFADDVVVTQYPPGYRAILLQSSADFGFVFQYPRWGGSDLLMVASNPDIGEPEMMYMLDGGCGPVDCSTTQSLSVGESFIISWNDGKSFKVERQSDSSDYKMFLVTALA
jgi:hypothetical protein